MSIKTSFSLEPDDVFWFKEQDVEFEIFNMGKKKKVITINISDKLSDDKKI